ncbi:hypothetical protein ABPG75_010967 [Micractinium tetrahymenae]
MLVGSVELQMAMAQQQQQQQQQHAALSLPWAAEHQAWQQREAQYREQLERHYFAQQEAEFNAGLSEYYAARLQHQEQQQRLNQVLYGYPGHNHMASHSHSQHTALHLPHPLQQGRSIAQAPAQQGADSCMADCSARASPRQPLASVCNHYGGHGGASAAGGMQWEGVAGLAGRKRGHEATVLAGEQSTGYPDSAFKRRNFRRD